MRPTVVGLVNAIKEHILFGKLRISPDKTPQCSLNSIEEFLVGRIVRISYSWELTNNVASTRPGSRFYGHLNLPAHLYPLMAEI